MSNALVQAAGLKKTFQQGGETIVALDGIDLQIAPGEFLIVGGESGSGKTTLLNLLGGLDRLTEGRLVVDGIDLKQADEARLTRFRRERIGFVFQDFCLVQHLTALGNVTLPLWFSRRFGAADTARELLSRFGLQNRLDHRPSQLSRGERQRVALARALVNRPSLILADEPTGNLDQANGEIIWGHLCSLHETGGVTIVAATHDRGWQARARRVITLRNGRIRADRNPISAD